MRITTPFLVFFLLFTISSVAAQKVGLLDKPAADKVDKLMKMYWNYGEFNGNILVVKNHKVIYKRSYGMANMEWEIANQANTKFRIASLTKQFTAVLILKLVEENKIKLKGKISDYLPYYKKDIGEKVTIHHLLTHSSGIPNYTTLPKFNENVSKSYIPVQAMVEFFCSEPLEFESGKKFVYNNSGYFILGAIIEKVTGKSYQQALQDMILTPLQLNNTGYDNSHEVLPKRASGYQHIGTQYYKAPYLDMSVSFSAGALYSTIEDLYRWSKAFDNPDFLSKKSKKLIFTPHISDYGYGWVVKSVQKNLQKGKTKMAQHSGVIQGFNAFIMRLEEEGHTIILLNNTGNVPLQAMGDKIRAILYDLPFDLPKQGLVRPLLNIIQESNIQAAIKYYHRLKKEQKTAYAFNESQLNTLGYELLRLNRKQEAVAILELNVQEYPEAFNTYDSLAEALLANGEKAAAIKNYKISLELNPKNENAKQMLSKLNG